MNPSHKFPSRTIIIAAIIALMALVVAPGLFVSSSQTEKSDIKVDSQNGSSMPEEKEGDPRERAQYWEMRRGGITHRQIAEARKQAERMPQALALPRSSNSKNPGLQRETEINAVVPGSPWISFGPAPINFGGNTFSGRVPTIAVSPTDANTVYAGGANGGVWKSTSGGNSWTPMNGESTMPSLAMGSIAINPNNPNIIYAGTGEPNFGSSHIGRGVLKSTDGGGSWSIVGDGSPFTVGGTTTHRVLVSPNNTVWVACSITSPNVPGLYRSSDGGITWKRSKPVAGFANGVVWDVAMSADGTRMFAIVQGVGLFRSVDSGSSWTQITNGLTGVNWNSRARLAVARSNSSVAYVIIDPVINNAFFTANGGSSWSPMSPVNPAPTYGGYNLEVGVDPLNANTVYVLGFNVWVTTGGTTGGGWTEIGPPHVDQHAISFPPCSVAPCPYYLGNDGGVFHVQPNGSPTSVSITSKNTNLSLTEFTGGDLGVNFVSEPRAIGGSQDNGTEVYTGSLQWTQTHGADGGFAYLSHGPNTSEAYSEFQSNFGLFKSFDFGFNWIGFTAGLPSSVFFYPTYVLNKSEDQHLAYAGNNAVYEIIAPQFSWYQSSQAFTTIPTAIGIAPSNSAVIYAGLPTGSNGVIFRTASGHSGGASTYEARSGGLSIGFVVNSIAVDSTNPDTVYIAGSQFGPNSVFKTVNGGVSWTNISGNLPSSLPVFSIITYFAGPTRVIVIGTDAGVFFSTNEGVSWTALNNGLPNTRVAQLAIDHDQTTIAAFTAGRSAFYTSIAGGQSCTYSISPSSQSFPASGGTGSFNITAPAGCAWTAVSDAGFITVTSGASGSGNGTVGFSVSSNGSASPRSGHINIPTQSFTVNQSGAGNQSPVANPGGPYTGTVGSPVQFNGSNSFDPDGSITAYQWNFGDGTTGSGVMSTHSYASANTYTVTLTVTDNLNAQASASTTATIGSGSSQTPFNGPHNIPGITQAEDFDDGGEGIAYHDITPGNDFGQYRFTDVDIANSSGLFNDFDVANAWATEWLEYTVTVTTAGNYDIQASVASNGPGGTFHYEVDGVNKGSVTVPNTGGWGTFLPVTLPNISFTAGSHILRVSLDTNGSQQFPAIANFNYFNFVASSGGSSGPVGYWKFDEGSGTFAADSSGNGNHGTLTNGPLWTTGKVNGALSFDAFNDFVQVGARPNLIMSNQMTMSAWIFPTGAGGIIVNKEGEYEMAVAGTLQWAVANSVPGWAWIDTGFAPPLNQWSHVAVVYDNGIVRTYANGALVHTFNGSGIISDVDASQNDFRIGGRQCCAQYFGGRIDEVRMHNRALSASEIQALANTGGGSDIVWVEDSLPAGAIPAGDSEGWNWISSNPTPFSGALANQSNLVSGIHQHYFFGATDKLSVNTSDVMVAYVFLDPINPPSEVMLQWNSDSFGWSHRAYWGANNIPWGTDGTGSRRFMGALPATGSWVRLEVPASMVDLGGMTLNGLAFTLFNGRATWDHAGKSGSPPGPSPKASVATNMNRSLIEELVSSVSGIIRFLMN